MRRRSPQGARALRRLRLAARDPHHRSRHGGRKAMNCSFDQELLTGYFDGALDASERQTVESHIVTCSACLRQLEDIKGVATQLHALPRAAAPAAVREAVLREISRPVASVPFLRSRRWLNFAVAAAA